MFTCPRTGSGWLETEVNLVQTLPFKDAEESKVKGSTGLCKGVIKAQSMGHCVEELTECGGLLVSVETAILEGVC